MFDRLKDSIAKGVIEYARKYDANWFVRFQKIAMQEDMEQGASIGDAMAQHAWVNIAVSVIARNIARAPFQLLSGDNLVESGKEYDLFKNVNPFMSRFQLWEATESWLKTRGECIWIFQDGYGGGLPTEIWPVDPDMFEHRLEKDNDRKIALWVFKKGQERVPFTPEELIHFRIWNKWDYYRGVNPLRALSSEINQDWLSNKSNLNILQHGSVPGGILSAPDDVTISKEQAQEIRARWEQEHKGVNKAHAVSVLGNGMKYQPTQPTSSDMEFYKMKQWNRQTILAKYGVNPRIVSASEESSPLSGKDTLEQMKAFWNLTLIPELHMLEDKLETEFFRRFAPKLIGRFDVSGIPELQEDEDERFERYIKASGAGLLTINEARERLGLDPVAWGETWYKPIALVPVDQELPTKPVPEPKPPAKVIEIEHELFQTKEVKISQYPEMFKQAHWWKMAREAEQIEEQYRKELQEWLRDQRQRTLEIIASKTKATDEYDDILDEIQGELFEDGYWKGQERQLKEISEKYFLMGMEFTGLQLQGLFKDLGLDIGISFNIYETGALTKLKDRVNKGNLSLITDTVRGELRDKIGEAIKGGMSEAQTADLVRGVYNKAGNRAATIARTELGGVINDSRFEGFESVGFEYHSWLSARDGNVRTGEYDHTIDGEIVKLGERFSNGLRYPNDPDGEAGNVINCRCITLPEEKDNG